MSFGQWLAARFREPSSFAGLAVLFTAAQAVSHAASAGDYATAIAAAGAGLVAFAKAEGAA